MSTEGIREATLADVPAIVELGRRSLAEGPYAALVAENPEQFTRLAEQIISQAGRVLLWEEDGEVKGLLAFTVGPHFLSGEVTAGEIMWYVEPESRPGGAAMRLFWAAEELARELGATKMQFTAPTEGVGAVYKRYGYSQVEVLYQKEL